MTDPSAAAAPIPGVIEDIVSLFDRFGRSQYDESVSMTDHCLQTAALAQRDGATPGTIAAALLHDIGHFLLAEQRGTENFLSPDWDHETIGADWLRPHFPPAVCNPVALHVAAKRMLCATDPAYYDLLSEASRNSLRVQGGPMSSAEVEAFDRQSGAAEAVAVRRWDDDGKVAGHVVAPLADYVALLESLISPPALD